VIDSQLLLDDLKAEVTKLEDDLRARCDAQADVDAPLKAQDEAAEPRGSGVSLTAIPKSCGIPGAPAAFRVTSGNVR
jgi:hypothetical protein